VRELENAIKRALVLGSGDVLAEEDVRAALARPRVASAVAEDWTALARRELAARLEGGGEPEEPGPYWSFVRRLERAVITLALERSGGNQIQAARQLGINRNTLRKKIAELGIAAADEGGQE
jgi:two-component system nitrogen regulation response regulator GlnG